MEIFNPTYLYTREEIMKTLRISIYTLRRLERAGVLKPVIVGARQRYIGKDMQDFIVQHQQK